MLFVESAPTDGHCPYQIAQRPEHSAFLLGNDPATGASFGFSNGHSCSPYRAKRDSKLGFGLLDFVGNGPFWRFLQHAERLF